MVISSFERLLFIVHCLVQYSTAYKIAPHSGLRVLERCSRFDLEYWGLDYPPLTAYVSWVCGKASAIVEPASMELGRSRGYETPSHKVTPKAV